MGKKSNKSVEVPHQELNEFLSLVFNSEFNKPKDYWYDFDEKPSAVYLSLKSRKYQTAQERDYYADQLNRLYSSTTEHLGYTLRGLHVRANSKNFKEVFLHTSQVKGGIEKMLSFEFSKIFGLCNYFQCELPIDRAHEILFGRDRSMIDIFDEFVGENENPILYVPLTSIQGMIFSKV